ncbi:RNF213 [Mytilus coruscus]|uniref:RNF213 n=1 Tax=Mytilus coruscus TaxID=42192 RepID=A0A6J8ED65_MYTCO|nr:RNF213 [Mytilus coruscus]
MTKSYPIELVREALKHVSPDDIDEGLVWCMDNEETFVPEEQGRQSPVLTEPTVGEINYTGWTQTGQSLASITASLVSQLNVESKENSVDKLVKALEDLWNTFLNSISSSVSDYLSVEHLGLILNRLAEQEQMIVDRTFLPSFKSGEPNLIICPQSEIYNTVLSVYSHEDDRPLPQSDEVLLCTPQTTLDMIEIFWRRSLFANNSKVHCLVNADLLDYDVSDRGERTLERLMKNAESKGMKYRLVVICSSENEYKSRVVAALDKYHRPQLPIDVPNVRKYLLTKMKVERSTTGVRPASAVDFERCSVRVVKSWRAGVGKTLYKKRMVADLYKLVPNIPRRMSSNVTIPLHEKAINKNDIMDIFLQETLPPRCHEPRIFHIDISHEVQEGVDAFLFQLLILGCLGHSSGHVWRRLDVDYYIIESMPLLARSTDAKLKCLHHCLDILPHVMCRSPQESLEILTDARRPPDYTDHDRLFDGIEFKSPTFQRPYQYLKRLDTNCRLDDVNANIPEEDKKQCLNTLLRHCGIRDPSWSELHHFVSFLNKQLQDFEVSAFCGLAAVEDLPGFAKFVLRFLIQMSRDFSTRSLKVSEESPIQMLQRQISDEEEENKDDDNVIQLYQMRRTWETSPHPYLFFNPDHHSMTFLGFNIDRRTGNLIDLQTRNVLEEGIMQQNLFDALVRNRVNLAENFDALPRHEKILKLCNVMGLDMAHDPDDTYELTTDNVKKILAIYMRFSKVYCLVNADLLDYDVSDRGERTLERLMKNAESKDVVLNCKIMEAGVGKTLYKKRMVADLYKLVPNIPRRMSSNVTIPLHEKAINTNDIMDIFLQETLPPRCHEPRIFHIDISHEVQEGVDAFLFQLLILGCLGHSSGHVWRRLDVDYYIIESMPLLARSTDAKKEVIHCGIRDPSWSELYHFVSFLNKQLQDFEVSAFCGLAAVEDFTRFLPSLYSDSSFRCQGSLKNSEDRYIQMLQRQVSDEEEENKDDDNVIQLYQMRRTWQTSPHPYLFFNPDHHSMTFLGFNIDRRTGNLIDLQTKNVLEEGIMQQNLFDALSRNRVNLAENFDALPRHEKILKLCNVMGLDMAHDPDDTCDIPVIIMGETGCGKTRLIKFMCSLQQPPGATVDNMILMKVHGGTKVSDIKKETNTTEAIGVIKEIMCDRSLEGKPIKLHEKLKIVAACNPYRKHSDELIKRLEQAGLGYHVDADKTTDKLGRVPMRRLVYRVQPLPQSMLPLVWDFGQLNTEVEEMYIRQMVLRYVKNQKLPAIQGLEDVVSKILTVSQDFMRNQKDECSFVSLRDVERVLEVMSWFYRQSEDDNLLFQKMNQDSDYSDAESEDENMEVEQPQQNMDEVTRSLVLALGVCYHACLKNREEYRETVAQYFRPPLQLPGGAEQIEEEIIKCQKVFLDSVELAENIAKNQALKENVFMMVVCIELRIPMFLVGKPGSSKSLAKTIVADAMQGNAAHKALFKNYKQVQMISYQCSPISVPEGIVGTFRQCAAYQKDKNLDRFVSVVVLDEIGLAEDSPKMPLKTLHPLLEDGCPDDEDPEPYKKVAFIGISNWALDPAKMNRGILVQREVPDITELRESAEGICSTDREVLKFIKPMIVPMADSYLELFEEASTEMREFFGLRDFYSLLKMLYAFVSKSRNKPSWQQLKHSILRNFGGLEKADPVNIFYGKLSGLVNKHEEPNEDDPDCTSAGMIQACLSGAKSSSESRYLLLLTENYGALTILQQKISMHNAVVIFGSSFPSDQEYTQVCRNINRIKVCMETGSTVILLNLENLYESLYDALNQYYVQFGGERYVDLGLGTHRVKCRVHRNFRLIVVAEKQIVYDKFPIPLINRLEKHFLSLKTMLTPCQLDLTEKLQEWAQNFCEAKVPAYMRKKKDIRKIGDAFMGYHADTCAAIILHVCQEKRCNDEAISQIEKEILCDAQSILLWCATPAAVWQLDDKRVFNTYFTEQHHDSLANYLHYKMVTVNKGSIYAQITTNSKLMSTADIEILCRFIPIQKQNVTLLTLQSFDTEQQFNRKIKYVNNSILI